MRLLHIIELLLFISLFTATNGSAQSVDFYQQFASNRELIFKSIDTTSDGGYISAGHVKNSIGSDYVVVKVDSLGNEEWRRENHLYNTLDSSNRIHSIKQLPDSTFIMCGEIDDYLGFQGSILYGYLIKLNKSGGLIWEKLITDTCHRRLIDLQVETDNTFLVLGEKIDTNTILTLEKFDSSGNTIWYTEYSFPPYLISNNSKLYKCLGSDYMITVPLVSSNSIGVIRVDSLGGELNKVALNVFGDDALNIKEIDGSRYKLATQRRSFPYNSRIISLDSSFVFTDSASFSELFTAVILDSLIFFGAMTDITIYKGSLQGDTIWHQFIYEPSSIPYQTIINRKGCAVTCGYIDDGSATSSIGFILEVCDSGVPNNIIKLTDDEILSVYPNPTSKDINIKLNNEYFNNSDSAFLVIYDIKGKLIRKIRLTKPEFKVDGSNISPGIYSVSLENYLNERISKIIIIK